MLDKNGSMIRNDIIEAFDRAVNDPENINTSGGINWDFVEADLNIKLGGLYSSDYLYECFDILVDNYFGEAA